MRTRFGEIAAAAEREQLTYLGFLAELVMAECDDRTQPPAHAPARTPPASPARNGSRSSTSPPTPPSTRPPCTSSPSCEWVRDGQPLCLIGDSGTGKTHLLIALGTAAAEHGYRVKYTLASKLVNELAEAADDRQLSRTIARYGRVDLLLIDELGYLNLDRRGAELLFEVLTEREERSSMAIASNEAFSSLDQDLHRPPALRRHRRPAHLQRPHHRNRHQLLPARPRPINPGKLTDSPGRS